MIDWFAITVLVLMVLSLVAAIVVGIGAAQYVVLLAVVVAVLRGHQR